MVKLLVKSDETEYKVDVYFNFNCLECNDLYRVYKYVGLGAYMEVPCPYCNYIN